MDQHVHFEEVREGQAIGPLLKTPTHASLFMYSAAVWLVHRIYYHYEFATTHEHLPDLVVHGTLAADWCAQMLLEWGGPASHVWRLNYQNRGIMLPDETVTCAGTVTRKYVDGDRHCVDCDVWLSRPDGEKAVTGSATIVLPRVGSMANGAAV